VQILADGKVEPQSYFETKSVKTEGNTTTMVLKSKDNGFGFNIPETKIKIERDDQGRIVKITEGGERPSDEMIRMYRSSMGGGYVAGSNGGIVGGFGGG